MKRNEDVEFLIYTDDLHHGSSEQLCCLFSAYVKFEFEQVDYNPDIIHSNLTKMQTHKIP